MNKLKHQTGGPNGSPEVNSAPGLAIFKAFKTKPDTLSVEARRQRSILAIMATSGSPLENTRTAIAQTIAAKDNTPWKNVYSSIFRDFESVLVPLGMVRERGRLPLKRGPKALQEKGVPYYELTEDGAVVAAVVKSSKQDEYMERALMEGGPDLEVLLAMSKRLPDLVHSIMEAYVRAYTEGRIERLAPITIEGIKVVAGDACRPYAGMVAALAAMSKAERDGTAAFFREHIKNNGTGATT